METVAAAELEAMKQGAVSVHIDHVISINDTFYKIDVLSKCEDGVVLHATALGKTPVPNSAECFERAAKFARNDEAAQ